MGMQEALAALDKANVSSTPQEPLQASMISAEQEKAKLGAKSLDTVMTQVMRETNSQSDVKGRLTEKYVEEKPATVPLEEAPKEEVTTTSTPTTLTEEPSVPKVSPQFEAIARQQRRMRQQQAMLQKEREVLAREKAELENLRRMQLEMKKNPLKALEYGGINYKQLTDAVLKGDGTQTPELAVSELKDEVAALREQREKDRQDAIRNRKLAAQREAAEVEQNYLQDILDYGKVHADDYELVNMHNAHNQVYQIIDNHYRQTIDPNTGWGKILSIKEGYDILEKLIEGQIEKSLQSKKWQARSGQKTSSPQSAKDNRTLNNNMTSSAPTYLPAKSEEERMARALAALSK